MSLLIISSLFAASAVYSSPLSTSSFNAAPVRSSLSLAPLYDAPVVSHGVINNSYIVMLNPATPLDAINNHFNFLAAAHEADPFIGDDNEGGLKHVYDTHVRGYAGSFSDEVVERIRSMPEVDFIERDQIVKTMDTQKGAPWGLARISHRKKLRLGTFTIYDYIPSGGEGVDVYVIDTGINTGHVEFATSYGSRAKWGYTVPKNDVDEDGNGHGSHCAGTIAGSTYGVAKQANVIAVKVLGSNGSGSMSDVIAGVDWASKQAKAKADAADAEFKATGKSAHKGSVANMSLGGGKSPALDLAVNKAVDNGLHFAVAAGNDNKDACNYSPAAAEKAVTVGASTIGDERAYFSNFGKCVDVFGPGMNIRSIYIGGPNAVATLSGTSMASPHVAGLIAYFLSIYPHETFTPKVSSSMIPQAMQSQRAFSFYRVAYRALPGFISNYMPSPALVDIATAPTPSRPVMSPLQLKTALLEMSTKGALDDISKDTVNKLIFNNATTS
ncbi:peptidase S8/S53 domain-containing protein [Mycena floridula]|nr:peptidase S8/S53 domain-containing protein [Mycena floridula]